MENTWDNWLNYVVCSIKNHENWLIAGQQEFQGLTNRVTGVEERVKIREEQRKKMKKEGEALELRVEKMEEEVVSLKVVVSIATGLFGVGLTIIGILASAGAI